MQPTHHDSTDGNINFHIPDEFENLEFSAVTEGLGFHHDRKKSISHVSVQAKSVPHSLPKSISSFNRDALAREVATTGGFEAFYSDELGRNNKIDKIVQENVCEARKTTKAKREVLKASFAYEIVSLLLDLVIVLAICSFAGLLSYIVCLKQLGVNIKELNLGVFELFSLGIIFIGFFLAYFTFSDLSNSFGKRALKIRLRSTSSDKLNVGQTFLRSITILFSIPAFGLPLLLDFHGKLSDTEIVK